MNNDLLIELGTEELPPKALTKLSNAFAAEIRKQLETAELPFGDIKAYATPRRLALLISDVAAGQPDRTIDKRGPNVKAAHDKEGKPSKAAEGFARSCGITFDELQRIETDKGEFLFAQVTQKGASTAELMPAFIEQALARLPIPKRMRWGSNDFDFIRPVKWLTVLHGDQVIPCTLFGIEAGRTSRGHRFHAPEDFTIDSPTSYVEQLRKAHVIADTDERIATIRQQVEETAASINCSALMDEELLEEVAALVEWPVPVLGQFDEIFLTLPPEIIINTVKDHQRYFVVKDAAGELTRNFITLSNIESTQPDEVRKGNERVVRPRLADALFFWDQDAKRPLDSYNADLDKVTYNTELKDQGSLGLKVKRVHEIAKTLNQAIGADATELARASVLSRCDLLTSVVYELPELQGIIGEYYAKRDGEAADVASAMNEQYMPRFAGDDLPSSDIGAILSVADRLDTIAGIFLLGKKPTGDKDPYALRRAALGIIRILFDRKLDLQLTDLISVAVDAQWDGFADKKAAAKDDIHTFFMDRLRVMLTDQGTRQDVFAAVLAKQPATLPDFAARVAAVETFLTLDAAEALAAANKRTSNILKKADVDVTGNVDTTLLADAAETKLANALSELTSVTAQQMANNDYAATLQTLSALRADVDSFFDDVMVNVDDVAIKTNRLNLLASLRDQFLQVADLSQIQA